MGALPDHLYPVTIIRTRYGGCYEGGEWAAFLCDSDCIPDDATGDDISCGEWWVAPDRVVATGSTPDEALRKLMQEVSE